MILLTCSCLNIRVHGKGSTVPHLQDVSSLNLPKDVLNDQFFLLDVYVVTLDLAGVTMGQKLLSKVRRVSNVAITTCTCCEMDVYAQCSDDEHKVFVSNKAQKDSSSISSLMSSDNYSSLFKLVLPEINDNFIQNNIGIELHNGYLDLSIEHVQTQVSNYLKDEQKAMEERIKQFTDQQQAMYANLLQRVRKHKQSMVYLLLKAKEDEKPEKNYSSSESPLTSPSVANKDIVNDSSTSTDSAYDRSEASEISQDLNADKHIVRTLRRTVSNPVGSRSKGTRRIRRAPNTIDVGGVFDMEEFDPQELYSDEDSEESDSNLDDTVQEKAEERLCATSLPMSIPAFSKFSRLSTIDDDDRVEPPKNPEEMAASMRALAWSVRDGTEMFGELPRRRLNTGELLAYRPS